MSKWSENQVANLIVRQTWLLGSRFAADPLNLTTLSPGQGVKLIMSLNCGFPSTAVLLMSLKSYCLTNDIFPGFRNTHACTVEVLCLKASKTNLNACIWCERIAPTHTLRSHEDSIWQHTIQIIDSFEVCLIDFLWLAISHVYFSLQKEALVIYTLPRVVTVQDNL